MTIIQVTVEQQAPEGGVELELTMPGPQGPPGPAGPPGPQGPPGASGGAIERQAVFASPLQVWEMSHDVPVTPSVHAYDTNGALIQGDVSFPTPTSVRVEWAWPMAGRLVVTT